MARSRQLAQNSSLLQAALEGLEAQRRRIEEQIEEVRSLLGTRAQSPLGQQARTGGRRQLSAAARKRIAAAQRKRWAAYRKSAKQR